MNPIIDSQAVYGLTTFGLSLLLGAGCCAVLMLFKLWRTFGTCRAVWVLFQDVLFCLICGAAVFLFALVFCDGVIRGYVLVGAAVGGTLFYFTVGEAVMSLMRAVASLSGKIFARIRRATAGFCGKRVKKSVKTPEKA